MNNIKSRGTKPGESTPRNSAPNIAKSDSSKSSNVRLAERSAVVSAIAISTIAYVLQLQPIAASAGGRLTRWISIGAVAIPSWVLLVASICCAVIFAISVHRNIENLRFPTCICSTAIACIAAISALISLCCLASL